MPQCVPCSSHSCCSFLPRPGVERGRSPPGGRHRLATTVAGQPGIRHRRTGPSPRSCPLGRQARSSAAAILPKLPPGPTTSATTPAFHDDERESATPTLPASTWPSRWHYVDSRGRVSDGGTSRSNGLHTCCGRPPKRPNFISTALAAAFVADIHQPLSMSAATATKGGNAVEIENPSTSACPFPASMLTGTICPARPGCVARH